MRAFDQLFVAAMAHCGLDDVLDCWGEWRLSHEERMGCLRTYLTAMGAAISAKAEEGDIVEGKSTAKGLAGTPRSNSSVVNLGKMKRKLPPCI